MNGGLRMAIGGLAAAGLAAVYTFDPSKTWFYPPCPLRALTGLQCPGCGGTRALHALLHGDVAGAFAFNPMLFVAIATAIVVIVRPVILTRPWFAWLAGAVLLGWGIARNVI